MPSATIEGSFVIQDLQSASRPKSKFSIQGKSANLSAANGLVSGYMTGLAASYVVSGTNTAVTAFLITDELETGIYDISRSQTWLGQDNGIAASVLALQAIGTSSSSVPVRPSGYIFGY
jgi:hypothetical protein